MKLYFEKDTLPITVITEEQINSETLNNVIESFENAGWVLKKESTLKRLLTRARSLLFSSP